VSPGNTINLLDCSGDMYPAVVDAVVMVVEVCGDVSPLSQPARARTANSKDA
jgi:hypothetical protein